MTGPKLPIEAIILLQNSLEPLPARSAERRHLVGNTASTYGVSTSTVYRALRQYHKPHAIVRADYDTPRIESKTEMKKYCELITALKLRTSNKKHRHLSTNECIRLLEECGVETPDGLVKAPKGLLKRTTVERYMKRWGLNYDAMQIEPPSVRFQAAYSNDCWQFDFSP